MAVGFEAFYENPNYCRCKKYLFSYRLRRRKIGAFLNRSVSPVLDIGCGISPMASDGVKTFLGDKSFVAMKAMLQAGHRAVVLDIKNLGIRSGSVPTIICSEVLEHIDDDGEALEELCRVLKPGGSLILTVPLHQHYWRRDDEVVGHYRRYDPGAVVERLQERGLEILATGKIGSIFERYLTLAALLVFLKADGAASLPGRGFLSVFSVANKLAAFLLEVASVLSPEKLNSVGLVYCRKIEDG